VSNTYLIHHKIFTETFIRSPADHTRDADWDFKFV